MPSATAAAADISAAVVGISAAGISAVGTLGADISEAATPAILAAMAGIISPAIISAAIITLAILGTGISLMPTVTSISRMALATA
jgi:hypothetical protein